MVCKLCHSNNQLRNSHIISETFWKAIYDKKHRAVPLATKSSTPRFIQNGIQEKLLCESCEQKFSKWECVLQKSLVDMGNRNGQFITINQVDEKLYKVKDIKYKEFKLAILSILWRMSITSHPFFKDYNLGVYNEKFRQILLDENVPDEKQYSIMVSRCEIDNTFHPDMIFLFPPVKHIVQSFVIWGHHFKILMNDEKLPEKFKEYFLRDSGELFIYVQDFLEFAHPESVFSRIFDKDVENVYKKMKYSVSLSSPPQKTSWLIFYPQSDSVQ
jgi:hypothetical protein